ncbi:hypothetical protein [Streptomyces sp. x-80]|uniref:hypothetical protein n=1 Tax=Streptomyces sp. x-80 TaxID=2789282 RepID=UPI00397FED71
MTSLSSIANTSEILPILRAAGIAGQPVEQALDFLVGPIPEHRQPHHKGCRRGSHSILKWATTNIRIGLIRRPQTLHGRNQVQYAVVCGPAQAGGMAAPITVHRLDAEGGRRVAVRLSGRTQILGIAYADTDVLEFLRRAGLPDAEVLLDDPAWVEWHGAGPHEWA